MLKHKQIVSINILSIIIILLIPASIFAMDRPPEGPTAIVVDDETGKPIEGAVALAIWRGYKDDCTFVQGIEGGCWGFKKAEEALSDKEGRVEIKDFWRTTKGPGKWGSAYDPRLTVYKFGYVCWDQKEIFEPNYKWTKRTDFDKTHRIVRLKKWSEGFSFREHASFEDGVTNGDATLSTAPLFTKAFRTEGPAIAEELERYYQELEKKRSIKKN
ncbi:MAG TPA: hypothetical protein VIO64_10475 [Pseudobacteroides sp.]|uniref:hypothetical protein n=1 Tax=Pseudobacteroides sp. TaxID=1968840 RepID=UPI002F950AA2